MHRERDNAPSFYGTTSYFLRPGWITGAEVHVMRVVGFLLPEDQAKFLALLCDMFPATYVFGKLEIGDWGIGGLYYMCW